MKIIVPIRPKNFEEFCVFEDKINKRADIIEIWLDEITDQQDFFTKLKEHEISTPLLGVCKTKEEKGVFDGTMEEKISMLLQFLQSGGALVDLDVARNTPDIIQQIPAHQLILSFHDFEGMPKSLSVIVENMNVLSPQIYKLAVTPQTKTELEAFLSFAQKIKFPCIFTTMGDLGEEGRKQLAPYTYAGFYALDEASKTASGQPIINNE